MWHNKLLTINIMLFVYVLYVALKKKAYLCCGDLIIGLNDLEN